MGCVLACQGQLLGQSDPVDMAHLLNCEFSSVSDHPYYPFSPGDSKTLTGDEDGETITLQWDVLSETKTIELSVLGETREVICAIIREEERTDGELTEISLNYFAQCRISGSVYYFGEDVDIYEAGQVVSHDGAWIAGQGLNEPGMIMPGNFVPGEVYFQEFAPGIAEDIAENIAMSQMLSTPAGTFEEVIEIWEYTPLDPADEPSIKHYARGIGLLTDNELTLTRFTQAPKLTLARAVKVTWPSAGGEMQLQSAATPQGPWNPISAEIDRITPSGEREVWVIAGGNNRFFRLAIP